LIKISNELIANTITGRPLILFGIIGRRHKKEMEKEKNLSMY